MIDFSSSNDLGAKTTFYDYIEEEFEEDDEKDWIKLNNNVFIDIEGIPYSIFI
ncbi:hypothetical protein [Aliarcobacter cryaerophilus]|nr:hypothetical protein [Aliarcobacter cryaerophilus]